MSSGFYQTPGSKAIIGLVSLATVGAQVLEKKRFIGLDINAISQGQYFRIITSQLAFSNVGELVFGVGLLYSFRQFERRMGTSAFLSYSILATSISVTIQILLLSLYPEQFPSSLSSGPYGFIFSLFVYFFAHVPKLQHYSLLGIELSDKSFFYALGLQFVFSHGKQSAIPSILGFVAGILCKTDYLPIQKFRFPKFISKFCEVFIYPILRSSSPEEIALEQARLQQRLRPGGFDIPQAGGGGIGRGQTNRPINGVYRTEQLIGGGLNQFTAFGGGFNNNGVVVPAAIPRIPPSEENINTLMALGFSREQSIEALERFENNVDHAANYLVSR